MTWRAAALAGILTAGLTDPMAAATLTVERASGRPGAMTDLEVRFEDAADLGSFDVVLAYDPEAAQAVGALPGPALEDSLFRWSEPGPGRVLITAGDIPPLPETEALFAVTFQLYAPDLEESPVTVDLARAYRRGNPEPLELTTEDGALIFRAGPPRWVWALAGLILAGVVFATLRVVQSRRRSSQET